MSGSSKKPQRSPVKRAAPPKITEKEKEEELLRRVERNERAFEGWLERKKETDKVEKLAQPLSKVGL